MRTFQIKSATQSVGPLPLANGRYTIGSAKDASIQAAGLPPVAFELVLDAQRAYVTGRVLLLVGGLPLHPGIPRQLRPGEVIANGTVVFVLGEQARPRGDTSKLAREIFQSARAGVAGPAFPALTWLTGSDLGRSVNLFADEILIGRGMRCAIRLRDRFASREHARIVLSGFGARLVDLGSANGTRVNGQRVRGGALLRGGDLIEVGATLLAYDAPARLPPSSPRPPPIPGSEQVTNPGTPF